MERNSVFPLFCSIVVVNSLGNEFVVNWLFSCHIIATGDMRYCCSNDNLSSTVQCARRVFLQTFATIYPLPTYITVHSCFISYFWTIIIFHFNNSGEFSLTSRDPGRWSGDECAWQNISAQRFKRALILMCNRYVVLRISYWIFCTVIESVVPMEDTTATTTSNNSIQHRKSSNNIKKTFANQIRIHGCERP